MTCPHFLRFMAPSNDANGGEDFNDLVVEAVDPRSLSMGLGYVILQAPTGWKRGYPLPSWWIWPKTCFPDEVYFVVET